MGSMIVGVGSQSILGDESSTAATLSSSNSGQLKWVRKGALPSRGTAQQNLSMAQGVASRTTTRVANSSAPATVLRWRTPEVARTEMTGRGSTEPIKIVTVSDPRNNHHSVRQVSATDLDLPAAVPDAFEDPFEDGDRHPKAPQAAPAALKVIPAARLISQQSAPPAASDPAWQDDPPPRPQLPTEPQGQLRTEPQTLPQEKPALKAPPQQLPPPQPLPSPPDSSKLDRPAFEQPELDAEAKEDLPCDRTYNRRDCCADGDRCEQARVAWQRDAIARISLDITPNMHPEEVDPVVQEAERNRDLAGSPVRTWRDRQGNVLAEGRLTNIKRGRLLVLDPNNQVVRIPFNDLCDDDLCFLTAWWRVPTECTFGEEQFAGRNWAPSTLTWKASALCSKPLYFQETQLERYGHTTGPITQPFLSGAHFFASLVTLPYQAGINPPWECRYSLGYYRPGSCAPWLVPPIPLSLRGALWEAGAVVGGVAIFP